MLRLALAAVVVAAAGQRAEACSCVGTPFVLKGSVPRNVRLPVLGAFVTGSAFTLSTADETAVPAHAEVVPGGFFVVPDAPLAADTDFILRFDGDSSVVRTTNETDELPPGAPTLGKSTRFVNSVLERSSCSVDGDGFTVAASGFWDQGRVFQVFAGPSVDRIDTRQAVLVIQAGDSFFLGDGSICSLRFPSSSMSDLAIQIRAVDSAGNASALSNAVQLKSAGCTATGGEALAVLALILLKRLRRWPAA